ncbi:FAD-dependent oxidoreductase [Pinibacter aurantiacus]|uniref:FAD-dependent oxidoreductase n=1 Tax=Pinibacter aurantiacus TaxID=2851599 RepID=A0A9E2SFR4_9BACT|nr:FAD-dependent oxidoreductase [Pinibacter aurantiacus]MBV4360365.1 FAD-dependent oxidoreductase [Pinibacter aurantiacus]
MVISKSEASRDLRQEEYNADMGIVGGGLSGVCAAITAARQGLKIVLVQDRPVLGGNASSEVRLWILGATSHMGNNNRWSREGGVIDEILVENMYRNPEGNPIILDMILLDKVMQEKNITLLLNTAVYEVAKSDDDTIESIKGFCSQNSTEYIINAPLFCDASGDGILGFLSGAAFRMGAESKEEFNEGMAPDAAYGELLGHSLYFYSKDTGKPVRFSPPTFALDVTKEIPRFKSFNAKEHGCKLWWVEHGGRLDTVHDTETIKWELWKVVYGAWDYIKNSGNFPEAENLTLEWVGMIPGKRESRRFEGDYILNQHDLVEQRHHKDAVAYGGWSIDLHPADGVFSERQPCNQWHSKGIFQIPYRCYYSRNIKNLFLAGRIISVSHVAFGATRVMATSAYGAQVVAMAAALCLKYNKNPADIYNEGYIEELQKELTKSGQHIPATRLQDDDDLVQRAQIKSSSSLLFKNFESKNILFKPLTIAAAQMLPLLPGKVPVITVPVKAKSNTVLKAELRISSITGNFTPDITLAAKEIQLTEGEQEVQINFETSVNTSQYAFVIFLINDEIELGYTVQRITGLLSVFNGKNKAVSNNGKQVAPDGSGVDTFEFWCPQRRPEGQNLALALSEPLQTFNAENIRNGTDRPSIQPNAWVADTVDNDPSLTLTWEQRQSIKKINLVFDTDADHAMESVLMTHPETVMPLCVRNYHIEDEKGAVVYAKKGNYQTRNEILFDEALQTKQLKIVLQHPSENVPASMFAVRCYAE